MCLKRSFRSEVWGGLSQLIALEAASSKGHNWTKVNEREAEMSLLQSARAVRENAYAPYSGFKVGAALRTQSGTVYTGVNVENAAYPEGTCAEAGAIAAMVAAGETRISEIDRPHIGCHCNVCGSEKFFHRQVLKPRYRLCRALKLENAPLDPNWPKTPRPTQCASVS